MIFHQRGTIVIAMFVSVFLAGCAVYNPHVEIERPIEPLPTPVPISYGIEYAQNAQKAYRDKLAAHARLGTSGGAALITLGSAVLGLAAFDAHIDVIKGTALAGGIGYTIGDRYANEAHERIYIRGMEAMNCAVEAVLPLNFPSKARDSLAKDIDELSKAILSLNAVSANVQSQISLVESREEFQKGKQPVDSAQAEVLEARNAASTADKLYGAGIILLRDIDGAGTRLVSAVDRINIAIDRALQQTNSRMESVADIISQLSDSARIFAPGLDFASNLPSIILTPTSASVASTSVLKETEMLKEKMDEEDVLRSLRTELKQLSQEVAIYSQRVRRVVKSVNDAHPIETLKSCGVDTEDMPDDPAPQTG